MIKFTLPLYGVTKKGAIAVNWYRNAHYQTSNKAKIEFKKQIQSQLDMFDKIETPIKIKYTYYAKANNSPDLDNFVGTVKKFFQDALVESGFQKGPLVGIPFYLHPRWRTRTVTSSSFNTK